MNFKTVPINSIKPDPDQPRKHPDPDAIKHLAQSIKTEGVIAPIEIDQDNMIVTGEIRFLASKEAGLTEVPVKVISMGHGLKRLMRQVAENVHHYPMSDYDTMEAVLALYDQFGAKLPNRVKTLSTAIGLSEITIREYLRLRDERQEYLNALRETKVNRAQLIEANRTPDRYKDPIKQKVLSGELANSHAVRVVARAVTDAPEGVAEEILSHDFTGKSTQEVREFVQTKDPDLANKERADNTAVLQKRIVDLTHALSAITLGDISLGEHSATMYMLGDLLRAVMRLYGMTPEAREEWKQITDRLSE